MVQEFIIDPLWITLISGVIVAAIGFLIGWMMNNGYYSKAQGVFQTMVNVFENFGDVIKSYDPELYIEFEACIKMLTVSFEDNALTMAEFNDILKTFTPLYNRVLKVIAKIGTKTE